MTMYQGSFKEIIGSINHLFKLDPTFRKYPPFAKFLLTSCDCLEKEFDQFLLKEKFLKSLNFHRNTIDSV